MHKSPKNSPKNSPRNSKSLKVPGKVVFAPLLHHSQKKTQLNRSNVRHDDSIASNDHISSSIHNSNLQNEYDYQDDFELQQEFDDQRSEFMIEESRQDKKFVPLECMPFYLNFNMGSVKLPPKSLQQSMFASLIPEKLFDSVTKNQKIQTEEEKTKKKQVVEHDFIKKYILILFARGSEEVKERKYGRKIQILGKAQTINDSPKGPLNASVSISKTYHNPLLHQLDMDDQGNLFFSNIVSRSESIKSREAPFFIAKNRGIGYFYGSYSYSDLPDNMTPIHSFNFKFLNWKLEQEQKFVNSALEEKNKVIDRRYGHSMIYYQGNLYIFGGYMSKKDYRSEDLFKQIGSMSNSIAEFNLKRHSWSNIRIYQSEKLNILEEHMLTNFNFNATPILSNVPSPRMFHTATLFHNSMIIFGGLLQNDKCSNELFSFNLKKKQWKKYLLKNNVIPPARMLHSATRYKNTLLIYGGIDENQTPFDDFYAFNMISETWMHLPLSIFPMQSIPRGRFSHISILLPEKSRVYSPLATEKSEWLMNTLKNDLSINNNTTQNNSQNTSQNEIDYSMKSIIFETAISCSLIILGGYTSGDSNPCNDCFMISIPYQITDPRTSLPMKEDLSNISLIVDGSIFHVHSIIIYQSKLIHKICESKLSSIIHSKGKIILDFSIISSLTNVEVRSLSNILSLLYGGFVSDLSLNELKYMLVLAKELDIESIIPFLKENIDCWDEDQMQESMYIDGKDLLQNHLDSLYKNLIWEDCRFVSNEGIEFPSHSFLVSLKFNALKNLLASPNQKNAKIPLPFSVYTVRLIHAYIYCSESRFHHMLPRKEIEILVQLLRAASELQSTHLTKIVSQRIIENASEENYTTILSFLQNNRSILEYDTVLKEINMKLRK